MQNLKKIVSTTVAALVIALPVGHVSAEVRPDSIKIVSSAETVDVGKTLELDSVISPRDADDDDDDIVWTSSNSKIARVLDKYDDDTKIKGVAPGTVTITAKVRGTDISAAYKITVKKAAAVSDTSTSYNKVVDGFDKEIDELENEIMKIKIASSRSAQRKQYDSLEKRIEELNDRMDDYDDDLEDQYDDGNLGKTSYKNLDKVLDKLDDKLDRIEDYLEDRFEMDD